MIHESSSCPEAHVRCKPAQCCFGQDASVQKEQWQTVHGTLQLNGTVTRRSVVICPLTSTEHHGQ